MARWADGAWIGQQQETTGRDVTLCRAVISPGWKQVIEEGGSSWDFLILKPVDVCRHHEATAEPRASGSAVRGWNGQGDRGALAEQDMRSPGQWGGGGGLKVRRTEGALGSV
ncbi:histone-lysine N-methyltransferase SETD2 [Platysternon megacephalum]|uniref:Histone-lysine N-methyltransferase SETD2 n=1 Tax=Platysternon megacephalum TaxID=55544 RepID=A0A4D9E806_9SAUR|nr:histone-lysine N-methyltransferase SETD2 [Platysternon megacephalum]